MRDILVCLVILGTIPFILRYPWVGVLVFVWISLFSPHRYAWGFAYDLPFVMIIAIATMLSLLLHLKQVRFSLNSITLLLILLPLWMTVTLLFAFEPEYALDRWQEVMKAFVFIVVSATLLHTRKQLEALLWVLAISVGFYGAKGGLYTLMQGGNGLVWGPPGKSYISDNNAIAVALIMVIPLMHYLRGVAAANWVRWGLTAAMLLSGLAVLGTHSRGGFLAVVAMSAFLWLKSPRKMIFGTVMLFIGAIAIGFMPDAWMGRMETIGTYEQDGSAMTRLNVWHMAFNVANANPIVGGGFELYTPATFARYAPDPEQIYAAHSIYFQMLGEHGYVGLALFLALGIAGWRMARRTIAASRGNPDIEWCANLARAIQVSLVGFAVGGAFVNIAYWELQYYELVALVVAYRLAKAAARPGPARATAPALMPAGRPALQLAVAPRHSRSKYRP